MSNSMKSLMVVLGLKNKEYLQGMAESKKELRAMQKDVKSMQATLKQVGTAMAAFGAATTAAFGLTVKAAMEVEGTRTAFENLAKANGQSADEILKAMQEASKGTVSASDLMLAANRGMTLGVAKNSKEFASLMEIARDRARTMGMTTTKAFDDIVTGIGRGSPLILDNLGLTISIAEANEKYAKELGKTTSELTDAEKQQALLNEVLRQGQATIDKTAQGTLTASETMQALKASVDNVAVKIGQYLLPAVQSISKFIVDVVDKIKNWMDANPGLSKTLTVMGAALGVVTGVLGGLILIIPKVAAGVRAFGDFVKLGTGPIGWAVLAIEGLTAAGIALWQNWDKVKAFFQKLWQNMKIIFANAVKAITHTVLKPFITYVEKVGGGITGALGKVVGFFNKDAGDAIAGFSDKLKNLQSEIDNRMDNLIDASQAKKELATLTQQAKLTEEEMVEAARQTQEAIAELGTKYQDVIREWEYGRTTAGKLGLTMEDLTRYLLEQGYTADRIAQAYNDYGEDVNKVCQGLKIDLKDVAYQSSLTKDKMVSDVQRLTDQARSQAQKRVTAEKKALDDRMKAERAAHTERMAILDAEYNAAIKALDAELARRLEGFQDQIDLIDKQIAEEEKAERERQNQERIDTLNAQIEAEQDAERRAELEKELEAFLLELEKERHRQELEDQKQAIRDKMDEARKEFEGYKDMVQDQYDRKKALLEQELADLEAKLADEKDLLDTALEEQLARYDNDLAAFEAMLADELAETRLFVADYNALMNQLQGKTVTVTTVHQAVYTPEGYPRSPFSGIEAPSLPGFATGAIIKEPTLLTNIRTGLAVGVAGEAGIERLVPGNAGSNINISINNPVIRDRYDVKKLGKDLVAELRLAGVKI